jgi:hypothetical protein
MQKKTKQQWNTSTIEVDYKQAAKKKPDTLLLAEVLVL